MDITWLFWLVAKLFGLLLFGIIALYLGREIIVYNNLLYFKKQGVKTVYIPFMGTTNLWRRSKGSHDQLATARQFFEDNKDEPLIMMNSNKMTMSSGFLLDESLIKELLVKEIDCFKKIEFMKHCNLGFFFHNGQEVLESRAIYSEFFNYENLKKMILLINKEILIALSDFTQNNLAKDKYTKVHLKTFLQEIFGNIVNSILFGEEEKNLINGESLPIVIQNYVKEVFSIIVSPINLLSLDYLHDEQILPKSRRMAQKRRELEEACWQLYTKRQQQGPKAVPNLLDLLVQRNARLRAEGNQVMTKSEIAGHFNLLQFAGSDTSLETSTSSFMLMSKQHNIQDSFRKIVEEKLNGKSKSDLLTYDDLSDCEELDQYINEFIRLCTPIPIIAPREFLKPLKLGKYQFRKGDRLLIPSSLLNTCSRYHTNPYEFDPSRFSPARLAGQSRVALGTFGFGKRTCVGKALGELIVKTTLVHFVRFVDIIPDPDYIEEKVFKLAYGYANPTVLMKAI